MKHRLILITSFLALLTLTANAQQPDLDRIDEQLRRHLELKLPGWSYKRIEPIQGSKGVLIQLWSIENRAVRIVVTPMKSAQEAKQAMENFPKTVREAQRVEGVGDEAYVWGYNRRLLVFRRGKTVVDIETGANVDSDSDARSLTWSQKRAREESEVKRLTSEFAKHMVTAIDEP